LQRIKNIEGNGSVPFFVSYTMAIAEKAEQISQLAAELLREESQYFVVKVNVRPINNISVFVDGDSGITIEKCVKLNRALYKQIVELGLCKDGEFALEVSSPGVDEPLVFYRQYLKNVGRSVHVVTTVGREMDGILLAADEKGIEVEEVRGKGRKKELVKHFLLFGDIQTTTVNIVF
jgi:ribosome maturation factor RimP